MLTSVCIQEHSSRMGIVEQVLLDSSNPLLVICSRSAGDVPGGFAAEHLQHQVTNIVLLLFMAEASLPDGTVVHDTDQHLVQGDYILLQCELRFQSSLWQWTRHSMLQFMLCLGMISRRQRGD